MLTNFNMREMIKERSKSHGNINVAVLGAGWYGRGFVHELQAWPGFDARIIFNRTPEKAVDTFLDAGIPKERIVIVDSARQMHREAVNDKYIVCSNLDLIEALPSIIDVFFEATGDVLVAAETAIKVIKQRIHFVTGSSELDATIGYSLSEMAKEASVIYSNCDGDQPGVLARMITRTKLMGFKTVVAGNGKGFLNYHTIPEDIMQFVGKGQSSKKVTSFTDGSKQNFELAVLANGMDLSVDKQGMHGIKTTKDRLIVDFPKVLSEEGVVDYFMGDGQYYGMTVFVIGKREDPYAAEDLKYLRRGDGPYYLFFRDYHLCYFETPLTIAEAVLFNKPTIRPITLKADVLSVAKRNIKKGERLDGIGGYTTYGYLDKYKVTYAEKFLPLGLAEYAIANKDIPKDTPITYDMVEFPSDNLVLKLRREQDRTFVQRFK